MQKKMYLSNNIHDQPLHNHLTAVYIFDILWTKENCIYILINRVGSNRT